MMVRPIDLPREMSALRACVVELQESERALEPTLPPGEAMVDAYVAQMVDRCARWSGRIFVAEVDGRVVGFVSVVAEVPQDELDEPPGPIAYVTDLVVGSDQRRRGVGEALLRHARAHAEQGSATELRIGVLSRNEDALRLYRRFGFRDYRVELTVPLRRGV
jgi:ribosomal protein S18 acetylase RimI-like enzyme